MIDDAPERDSAPSGSRFLVPLFGAQGRFLVLALLGWALVVGFMQAPLLRPAVLIGPDSHYHAALSQRMLERGPFFDDFPWATETLWVQRYFDKDWLFHLYLAPFVGGDPVLGGKLAVLLLALGVAAAYWALLTAAGVRRPLLWVLALPLLGAGFLALRYGLLRPHVLSYIWLFGMLAAMLRRQRWWVAGLTVLWALSHASHWLAPGLVLAYDLAYAVVDDAGRRRPRLAWKGALLPWAVAGFVLGTLLHPQFPNNVSGLWVQNVEVLTNYWSKAPELDALRPRELQPMGWHLFTYLLPLTLLTPLTVAWAVRRRLRPSRTLLLLSLYALGFIALAIMSLRFIDYAAPLWLAALALVWAQAPLPEMRHGRLLAMLGIGGFLALTLPPYLDIWQRYPMRLAEEWGDGPAHAAAADYLDTHLAPGDIVYAAAWDVSAFLFLRAPRQRYLLFLDPVFMYRHDPRRFALWARLNSGELPNAAQQMQTVFGARAVLLDDRAHARLAAQMAATPGVRLAVYDRHDLLYLIDSPGTCPAAVEVP